MENYTEIVKNEPALNSKIEEVEFTEIVENEGQGFVAKNYFSLRSFIAYYHIIFGVWSFLVLMQILLVSPLSIIISLPLAFFIATSIIGGIKLLNNKKGGVNYLIVAQLPHLILFQLNDFLYQFYCGQWIMLNIVIDEIVRFGFNFGFLSVTYIVTFNSNLPANAVGINIVAIILIVILLRMEELGSK